MAESRMHLEDWLDDLCVRFIINLPEEDLSSVARICFQVEEAQWFYEDFVRPLDPSLPSMSLRSFCLRIFQHCPLLSAFSSDNHMQAFEEFLLYKTRVPVRGAILLNQAMDSVLLVKGWKKGANWSFPRGKINKDEDDLDCAIREVYEETGYDIKSAGLVPNDEDVKYIEITMREQHMRLYVFRNIPMDTHFEPRTRKEISKIQWYRLSDLPAFRKKGQSQGVDGEEMAVNANKFYMVAPFLVPLKKWVAQQRKKDAQRIASTQHLTPHLTDEVHTEEEQPVAPPFDNGASFSQTPGINTMEGATAALHRLLKIQPPTQGLQPEAVSAAQTSSHKSSGEALLALLQGKGSDSGQGRLQPMPPPQTPLDHTVVNAPLPKTPHHQQPRPPHFSSLPPPPNFNLTPQSSSSQVPLYQTHVYHNPNSNPNPLQQSQLPPQQIHRAQENFVPNFQSQHLLHPQPLPPHVQMGIFGNGQVHVPMVPQSINQPMPQAVPQAVQSVPAAVSQAQFSNVHGPMISPAGKQTSTQLTSHSLALLNAFKNRDHANGSGDLPSDLPLRRFTEAVTPPVQAQELSAVKLVQSEQHIAQVSRSNEVAAPARSGPNDEHRSALLNLFKAPAVESPSLDSGSRITGAGSQITPLGSISQNEPLLPLGPGYTPSPISTSTGAKHDTNGAHELQAKNSNHTSSPFRPTAILTRPSHQKYSQPNIVSQPLPASYGSGVISGPSNLTSQTLGDNVVERAREKSIPPSQPQKPFHPQILKRPAQTTAPMPAELAAPSSVGIQISQFQQSARETHSQEHKQTLLSMFGKGPSATLTSPFDQMKFPQTPDRPAANGPPRSRVGSLASVTGERRGSQTPISPADKGFLLGYLDAVTKNGNH